MSSRKSSSIKRLVQEIRAYDSHITIQRGLKTNDIYLANVRAAFVKSLEFCEYLFRSASKASFFTTATLRGICEDLIFLKALKNIPEPDRSSVVANIQMAHVVESCRIQKQFLLLGRGQIVLEGLSDENAAEILFAKQFNF